MKLSELIRGLSLTRLSRPMVARSSEIRAVTGDPEKADQETLFVCVRTAFCDGQYLTEQAYRNGCRAFVVRWNPLLPPDAAVFLTEESEEILAALAAKLYDYPAREMTVFGICGTAGKTAVVLMAEEILRKNGRNVGMITPYLARCGTISLRFGDILPDACGIQKILALFRQEGCEFVLIECNSYQLVHHAFDQISFAHTLLTDFNYRETEPGVHRTENECRTAIAGLLRSGISYCFLPQGCTVFEPVGKTVYFGNSGELVAKNIRAATESGRPGSRFCAVILGEEQELFLPVPGDFAVRDALAAIGLCLAAGLEKNEVLSAVSGLSPVGILEFLGGRNHALIFRDSAYRPFSLAGAIEALRPLAAGKVKVLFGTVGGRAHARRRPLALAAARADFLYLTADDPGCEDPAKTVAELAGYLPAKTAFVCIPDRADAIRRAVKDLCPGDVLLLAGKGLLSSQIVMTKTLPFDEKELVLECFRKDGESE